MNPAELELFLYRHTESENWHLRHPGQLSCIYDKMKQEEFRGEAGYCFDFVNTLKKDMIGMIKETRFTVIPKHHHVDMELYLQRVVHLCHQWQRSHAEKGRSVHSGQRRLAQRHQL